MTDATDIQATTKALVPDVLARHAKLVGIRSIAFPGFPEEPVHEMAQAVIDMLKDAGARRPRRTTDASTAAARPTTSPASRCTTARSRSSPRTRPATSR